MASPGQQTAGLSTDRIHLEISTHALQWRDVVLASFSQWHGTRRGANAMLVNATEDVQVWCQMPNAFPYITSFTLHGLPATELPSCSRDTEQEFACIQPCSTYMARQCTPCAQLVLDATTVLQARNDTVTVVEEVPLDPKRERMKHKNPRDTSWQQCACTPLLLLHIAHTPSQLGDHGLVGAAEAFIAADGHPELQKLENPSEVCNPVARLFGDVQSRWSNRRGWRCAASGTAAMS